MTEDEIADTQAVDELMDHVAALLQLQMRTANQHLRKRAARLLAPLRLKPSAGTDTDTSARGEEQSPSAEQGL